MRIKDKRFWFNYHTEVKCPENRGFDIGLGMGIAGCLVMALMTIMLLSALTPETHAATNTSVIGIAGLLKSHELKQKAAVIHEKAKAVLLAIDKEKRDPSDQEIQDLNAMNAETDKILAHAKMWERQENQDAGRSASPGAPAPNLDDDADPDKPKPAVKIFPTLGHQLQAIYLATVNGDIESRNKLMAAAAGSNEKVDTEGGFLVQADFSIDIEKRMSQVGQILQLISNPIEVSGNGLVEKIINETSRADGSRAGGVQGYWVDEAEAATATKPGFTKLETKLHRAGAIGYVTDELLEDFPAMTGLFIQEFAEELVFKTEDAIYEGDGAGKPLGITHASNPCKIEVAKETGQAADSIVTTNLSKMWHRMHARSRATSVWLYNQDLDPQFDVLSIPAGTGALEPRFVTYSQDGILKIKGRPAISIEYAAAGGDAGDICLADFTQYRLIRKGGVKQATSMHVKFTTHEMAFRATLRIGGQPRWKSAVTRFKGTGTVSPFITLAAR